MNCQRTCWQPFYTDKKILFALSFYKLHDLFVESSFLVCFFFFCLWTSTASDRSYFRKCVEQFSWINKRSSWIKFRYTLSQCFLKAYLFIDGNVISSLKMFSLLVDKRFRVHYLTLILSYCMTRLISCRPLQQNAIYLYEKEGVGEVGSRERMWRVGWGGGLPLTSIVKNFKIPKEYSNYSKEQNKSKEQSCFTKHIIYSSKCFKYMLKKTNVYSIQIAFLLSSRWSCFNR